MTSTVKVNNVQASDGGNIINQCGTTITLGASGDTIALASGASQTGFGRTGTVDWVTTIQTSTPFTAVSGKGYFINTTSGAITMNLPSSPSVGDIVAIKDYAGKFATNALTIGRGGSNMNGSASDSARETNNESLTLVYADSTQGWIPIEEGTGYVGETYITATGGTITTSGDFKIHTFTGPGTFTVCSLGSSSSLNKVSYVVVAGGAGGGHDGGGGGGAGGYREGKNSPVDSYTASPLAAADSGLTVTATSFPITVGAGSSGTGSATCTSNGSNSVFSTITSAGGGGSGTGGGNGGYNQGKNGGSGGGGAGSYPSSGDPGGSGNTPPVSPPQGNNGGFGGGFAYTPGEVGGGGGGATAVGVGGSGPTAPAPTKGNGGDGATSSINGTPTARGGGGGGGGYSPQSPSGSRKASGGAGGGGAAGFCAPTQNGTAGTANTGGGGGGASGGGGNSGGSGGSGIVIIRYKFQ